MHELMHVLGKHITATSRDATTKLFSRATGFYHEQSRPDRDSWVEIVEKNIVQDMLTNFQKMTMDDTDMLNLPYDYDSIMHYGRGDFARTPGTSAITVLPC